MELPIGGQCSPGLTMYFFDFDGDGYGNPNQPVCSTSKPSNAVVNNLDCNDSDPTVNVKQFFYADGDNDGFGDPGDSLFACLAPPGYVANNDDNCPGVYGSQGGCPGGSVEIADESFESGLGLWTQSSNDDMNWTRKSGGTSSSGTGPTGAFNGSYYLYTEASGYNNKVAILESPDYELETDYTLSFYYHMYGSNMGSLIVQTSYNGGISWGTVWSISGDQGNSWKERSVTLNEGNDVRIRFRATTGGSFRSDISIDNLRFTSDTGGGAPILSNENYVFTRQYQRPFSSSGGSVTSGDVIEEVTYFDGLGRPMQKIGIQQSKQSGSYKDLITPITYDAFGRPSKDHLSYPSGGTLGSYRSGSPMTSLNSFYSGKFGEDFGSVVNPYSEKEFESSPLNRIKKQAAPGSDWRLGGDHEVEFDYQTNVSNEVRLYTVTFSGDDPSSPYLSGGSSYYAAGELYKTVTYNENNENKELANSTEEFKDKMGRVVLTRTYNGTTAHDTFYVYDDYGNLTYVLSPKAEAQGGMPTTLELNELCYQYKYDRRNRIIEKKLPGKGWEYSVYNKLDQPVMTQDAIQRSKNEWLFTKYDAFGRVAYTGLYKSSTTKTRTYLQSLVENGNYSSEYVSRSSSNTYAGTGVYYNNSTIPSGIEEVYTINYYDNYTNLNIGFSIPSTNALGGSIVKGINTNGLATVSKTRVLGTSHWITTAMGYDDKGRVIWSKTTNPYLGTTDIVSHEVDFRGNILQTQTRHQKSGNSDIVITDTFTYDYLKRLKKHTQSINGGDEELIAANEYDELGQLTVKKVGNTSTSPLQEVTYDYNVRGWLKEINDPVSLGSDLFSFAINYNTTQHGGTKLYNGNISETRWKTKNDNVLRHYRYAYDDLNRIKGATSWNGDYNVSSINYDKNGNITYLARWGANNTTATSFGIIDMLSYGYKPSSNQIKSVNDGGNHNYGFKDNSSAATQYTYDVNGNLTSDANKGIAAGGIEYNHLNMPTKITVSNAGSNNGVIDYVYTADGIKLQKKKTQAGVTTTTDYAGKFLYKNGVLEFFNTPEGYVSYDNGQFNYVYNYVDHLGNVRLSYSDTNGDGQIRKEDNEILKERNYYPFGLEHQGYNSTVISENNYHTFNGKELEESLGLNVIEMDFRQYDNALGRFISIDALAELSQNRTPYRFGFNNPIAFSDPTGLWERKNGGWYTDDTKDIARFMDMIAIEEGFNGGASKAQIDTFIGEEFRGSGGRLSDGSILLDSQILKSDSNGNSSGFSARQVDQISNEIEQKGSHWWNEKSGNFNSTWHTYKYYRERSYHNRGGGFSGVSLGSAALSYASNRLNNAQGWYSFVQGKIYGHSFYGNQYTERRAAVVKLSSFLDLTGKALTVYGMAQTAQQMQQGYLTKSGAAYLIGTDAAGMRNPTMAAWSLGTSLGKMTVESGWYYNAVHDAPNW